MTDSKDPARPDTGEWCVYSRRSQTVECCWDAWVRTTCCWREPATRYSPSALIALTIEASSRTVFSWRDGSLPVASRLFRLLRTGEALRAPALDPIACWRVERDGDTRCCPGEDARDGIGARLPAVASQPASVGIVGGGAAAIAAAEMLRREGLRRTDHHDERGREDAPVDRPNLSKDYLAGEAQDDWIPMWPPERTRRNASSSLLRSRVASLDTASRAVVFENGCAPRVRRDS